MRPPAPLSTACGACCRGDGEHRCGCGRVGAHGGCAGPAPRRPRRPGGARLAALCGGARACRGALRALAAPHRPRLPRDPRALHGDARRVDAAHGLCEREQPPLRDSRGGGIRARPRRVADDGPHALRRLGRHRRARRGRCRLRLDRARGRRSARGVPLRRAGRRGGQDSHPARRVAR
jgi:hypothetical protein